MRRNSAPALLYGGGLAIAVALIVAACGASDGDASPAAAWRAPTTSVAGETTTTSASTGTSTTTTVVPAAVRIYRVRRGDTLTEIAKRSHVTNEAIMSLNHLANADQITTGQTLEIPPETAVALVIIPPSGPPNTAFELRLTGASPGDRISFEVRSPQGVFTGRAHDVPPTGTVSATYQTSIPGNIGRFTVIAHGKSGPVAAGTFDVVPNNQ